MHSESGFRIAPNWTQTEKIDNDVTICRHDAIVKFFDSGLILFLLSLVTGPNFMSEIPPSEFFLISGDWGELGIPNLVWMSQWNVTECCKIPGSQSLPLLNY